MIPRRPLKLIFFIAYLLIAIGLMLTENINIGFRLTVCGVTLILFLIAYILIVKITE
jgi:hypothetical protein